MKARHRPRSDCALLATVQRIHPIDAIRIRRLLFERHVIPPLHHNDHKGGEGDREPQDVQRHRQLEALEDADEVSYNQSHVLNLSLSFLFLVFG